MAKYDGFDEGSCTNGKYDDPCKNMSPSICDPHRCNGDDFVSFCKAECDAVFVDIPKQF